MRCSQDDQDHATQQNNVGRSVKTPKEQASASTVLYDLLDSPASLGLDVPAVCAAAGRTAPVAATRSSAADVNCAMIAACILKFESCYTIACRSKCAFALLGCFASAW